VPANMATRWGRAQGRASGLAVRAAALMRLGRMHMLTQQVALREREAVEVPEEGTLRMPAAQPVQPHEFLQD
jgi:hypothetical protein